MATTPTFTHPQRTRVWRIKEMPTGPIGPEHFVLREEPIPELKDQEILVRADYFSVDPYMRSILSGGPDQKTASKVGDVMSGPQVGTVIASRLPSIKPGQSVGFVGLWSEYSVRDGNHVRITPEGVDQEAALSVVSLTGLTAYFGLKEVANIKPGEKILVTSAGGGVGYLVCMLAQLMGAEPVALCGTPEKMRMLRDLGLQHVIDYKATDAVEQIRRVLPQGANVFWDSVGGAAVAPFRKCTARFGRIVQCGAISTYSEKQPLEPSWEYLIVWNRWTVQGFVVWDYHSAFNDALAKLTQWYRQGAIPSRATVNQGFEQLPRALSGLFAGENIGKQLVKVSSARPPAPAGETPSAEQALS